MPRSQTLTELGDKEVSDLVDTDIAIKWNGINGSVVGTVKAVIDWVEFNGVDTDEQDGHFFPIQLDDQYDGKTITVIGQKTKSAADTEWVLRVENALNDKFTFQVDGETIFVLDFSTATLE